MMMTMVGCTIAERLSNILGHIEVVIMMMTMVGCIIAERLSNILGHIEQVIKMMIMVGMSAGGVLNTLNEGR